MSKYDIIGLGGPILDFVLRVDEDFLEKKISGKKGGMEPIDYASLEALISDSGKKPYVVLGGSARNTLQGLSKLGERCALLGMVGGDERGKLFCALLHEEGIYPLLLESSTPTGVVLALVTPDGERTMRTFQGASTEIRGEHLTPLFFQHVRLVHIEGYALYNGNLVETAMRLAKEAGAYISFDMASFEIVEKFKEKILNLIETYVDIVFCNEQESMSLLGLSEKETAKTLSNLCKISVVLMGSKGCYVSSEGQTIHCPAYPVVAVDTTGAGDLFASGFLHAFLEKYPLEICAHYGAITGRAVVQGPGPSIPHEKWVEIFREL